MFPSVSSLCRREGGTVTNSRKLQGISRSGFPGRWSREEDGVADNAENLRSGRVGSGAPCTVWKVGTGASLSSQQRSGPGKDAGQVLRHPAALSSHSRFWAGNHVELGTLQSSVAGSHWPRFRKGLPTLRLSGTWRLPTRLIPAWL